MGIELPTPSYTGGEATGESRQHGEVPRGQYAAEQAVSHKSAEVYTTEKPAHQEVNTGRGVGDGFQSYDANGVSVTTNVSSVPIPATPLSLDDVPVVAADEDLIEKQWVDSAKKIIQDTRSDPYRQSEAISRLQADYLQKRYGKAVTDGGS